MTISRTRVNWEQVIGAIDDDKTVSTLLARIQSLQNKGVENRAQPVPASSLNRGGLAYERAEPLAAVYSFQTERLARETVCDAFTYVEDWLDYERPRENTLRNKIAKVRRRLEAELWGAA